MQKPQDQYDEAMQEYARKWMKSLDKPRQSTSISIFFLAIFIFLWSSTLTNQLGYIPLQGVGIIIFLCFAAGLSITLVLINKILSRIGFSKPIRSGLWFSALIGPYTSIVSINNSDNSALSHILGVVAAVLAFIISYSFEGFILKKNNHSMNLDEDVPNIKIR